MKILNFFKRIFMSEDNKIVDGAKDVVEGVADVTKETVGAVGDVAGEAV